MGILPIGFFSPLPLAMMIPFMATQSLAMGEAFGKSFQYGKRKISSMTNEEFNKLTFRDLMSEQTANIKAIIPELKAQMSMSQDMQKAIFQEMIQLIPTFFESFKKAIPTDLTETSLASPPPAITNIRYTTDRDFELQQQRIDDALKLFEDNFLKQQGTKESLAEKLAEQNKPPPTIRSPPTPPTEEALAKGKSLREDVEWRVWSSELAKLKQEFNIQQQIYRDNKNPKTQLEKNRAASSWSKMFAATSKIRQMSNDYRHPNNNIRENALRLRQVMAAGQWKRRP